MRSARVGLIAVLAAGLTLVPAQANAESSASLWAIFDKAADEHARVAEQVDELTGRIKELTQSISTTTARVTAIQGEVRKLLLQRFVDGVADPGIPPSSERSLERLAAATLTEVTLGVRADAVGQLRQTGDDLATQQSSLNRDLERQRKLSETLADRVLELRRKAQAALEAEKKAQAVAAERKRLAEQARVRAEREAAARLAQRQAAAPTVAAPRALVAPTTAKAAPPPRALPPQDGDLTDEQLAKLRACEAGGNYHNKANPRYRGGYQFARGTWDRTAAAAGRLDLVGVDPADAAPADQDAMARFLYRQAGAAPWPTCGPRMFS